MFSIALNSQGWSCNTDILGSATSASCDLDWWSVEGSQKMGALVAQMPVVEEKIDEALEQFRSLVAQFLDVGWWRLEP